MMLKYVSLSDTYSITYLIFIILRLETNQKFNFPDTLTAEHFLQKLRTVYVFSTC